MTSSPCLWLAIALLVGTGAGRAAAQEPASPATPEAPASEDTAKLRDEVERLWKALAEERAAREAAQAEALAAARAAQARAEALSAEAPALGFSTGGFTLRFAGLLQADAVAWRESSVDELSPATGEPLNQTRFLIRRARLRAEVAYKWLFGALELDANTVRGPTVRLLAGYAGLRWPSRAPGAPPYLALTVGLQRIPFGYELREPARTRFFLERSNAVQALFPSAYDLGAVLQGGWRFLRYAVAAMNGQPLSDAATVQFQARDPNQSKDFLGRLGVDATIRRRVNVQTGFSALYGTGFHAGTPGTKDVLVWRDVNEDGIVSLPEIGVIAGVSGTPSESFDRWGIGGDLSVRVALPRVGELAIYGEVIWAANLDRGRLPSDPVAAGRTLRQLGGYVAATCELTRWAQVGVRYDYYSPDADAAEARGYVSVPRDVSVSAVTAGVAARWLPYGRLLVEYQHNDNALGRTPAGLPARLADDALTLRAQVQF